MSGPTSRGPKYIRGSIKAHLLTRLPPLVPFLRGEWADEGAFPPAGPEPDADEVPRRTEQVQTAMGRPLDLWPLIQVELGQGTPRRASIETTEGSDSILYFVTYALSVFVYIDVDIPESVPLEVEREYATDVRDDLQLGMRYCLLDAMTVNDDPELSVLAGTYVEDYGEPQAAQGQRWTVGGRARFSLRAQERLTRPSLATVTTDGPGIDFAVQTYPVPVDHPALQ